MTERSFALYESLQNGQVLGRSSAAELQSAILNGHLGTDRLVGLFELFERRPITSAELLGIIDATKTAMRRVPWTGPALDTAGTGGDGHHSFNISTIAAVVCAACGVSVAKHGNRSASSKCGSADILEYLGVKIDLTPEQAGRCLEKAGIVFMFAPAYHPALRYVAAARKVYAKRTFYNFIGPLLNPVGATHQVIGFCDESALPTMVDTLVSSGTERTWLIRGEDGLDECSLNAPTVVHDIRKNRDQRFLIEPERFGLVKAPIEAIRGGEVERNAEIFHAVLENRATEAQRDIVLLNAAAGLTVYGSSDDLLSGLEMARAALKSGAARRTLALFKEISHDCG